jgi:hypothetical protein
MARWLSSRVNRRRQPFVSRVGVSDGPTALQIPKTPTFASPRVNDSSAADAA